MCYYLNCVKSWRLLPPTLTSLLQGIKLLLLFLVLVPCAKGALREEVKSKADAVVDLPCVINQAECGDFHSIKWYKENRRVYVYSPIANFAKAEGELVDRGNLIFDGNNATTRLQIKDLKTTDEGEYKCEITFLDITKDCPVVQLVKLTTLAEPKNLTVSTTDGRDISSSSIIGPFNEGHELRLVCESGGGKPIPRVTWYNGSNVISGKVSSFEEEDGTGTGRNEVRIKLSRGDLGSQFTCQAENEAIDQPLSTSVQVDVNLRPYRTEVIGADRPVEDGAMVSLMCRTWGARPAAVITWFNGSRPFSEQPAGQVALQDDNTYETQSRISFVASRFENGESITCEANNQVLDHYREEPQRAAVNLAVLYRPVVHVSPANITTNETREVHIRCLHEANPTLLNAVRWYRNGQLLDLSDRTRYEGATVDEPSLRIKQVSREDNGRYTCVLENKIGASESKSASILTVLYKPSVTLRMDPMSPISELDRRNVTLFCDIVSGYPNSLTRVNWYMDGNLLKELPDCPEDPAEINNDLCDIDPSKLLLEHVSKLFHGNYSCQAANEAGWSEMSEPKQLEIYYPPGQAFISKDTEMVVKGQAITLTCSVDEPGRPEATKYIWQRGGHVVNYVNSFNWTIDPVTLETEANISCVAVNEVGQGSPDFINIQVIAPPTFIVRLPPYTGAMAEVSNFSIECQVECSPLCEIVWLKDGLPINEDDERYTIQFGEKPPNYAKNDFESVYSTLHFNIDRWPGGKLDRIIDNANYTCQSRSWQVSSLQAEGVSSTTYFRVEYPPENIEISEEQLRVLEGSSPEKILCTAEAYPQANYFWQFNGETVATDNLLFFDKGIHRDQSGEYTCIAQNRHGSSQIKTNFDVLYKPECSILQGEYEGQIMLTCEAKSNPDEVVFGWIKGGNQSLQLTDFSTEGLKSVLTLDALEEHFGTYYCQANNSIGAGTPCEFEVQGVGLLKTMGGANIIIIVAVIAASIVAILVVIVVIILICRRRNASEKYTNHEDLEERENSENGDDHGNSTADTSDTSEKPPDPEAVTTPNNESDKPVHKWPIRPGVHVHVNGLHVLNNSSSSGEITGFSYGARNGSSSNSDLTESKNTVARGTSTADIKETNVTTAASNDMEAGHHNNAEAVSSASKTACLASVATAGTALNSSTTSASKVQKPKRKQHNNGQLNKSSPDSGYPGDGLNGDLSNGFYENLPFHGGMSKQQPHKQIHEMDNHTDVLAVHAIPVIVQEEDIVCPAPNCDSGAHGLLTASRPSSQLSQNGSSGYGSTRSQVGPFGTSNRPSPAASSSSSSSGSSKTASNKPKRSVWFGGSMRAVRAASAESETPPAQTMMEHPPEASKSRGGPQYASLRIPNRIRHHSSHGELPSYEDRGLDLAEAEVDSDVEERTVTVTEFHPLRHASSLEAQALTDPNTMGLPAAVPGPAMNGSSVVPTAGTTNLVNGGYRCGSNTSSSSGRGSSIQHASLPRHMSNRTVSTEMNSPLSEVPIITNGLPTVSGHIPAPPMQHHNLVYNTKPRPSQALGPAGNNYFSTMNTNNYYYHRPPGPPQQQYNSHYRGPQQQQPRKQPQQPLNNTVQQHQSHHHPQTNDYAILKFNANGNVGKEIDALKIEDEDLIYADSDYRDLYAYGPVSYTQTSREAAQTKKEEMAKRYGTIGRK